MKFVQMIPAKPTAVPGTALELFLGLDRALVLAVQGGNPLGHDTLALLASECSYECDESPRIFRLF